jgi:hypothetical protein
MADKLDDGYMSPRRRLEQLISNPQCDTNVTSALLQVRISDIAKKRNVSTQGGMSPFAFSRGEIFEKFLTTAGPDGLTPIDIELIRKGEIKPSGSKLAVLHGTPPSKGLELTSKFFRELALSKDLDEEHLAWGFRFLSAEIPPKGAIEIDLLLARYDHEKKKWILKIGEIKVYPDRAGLTDAHQLATARAQAGLYRRLLRKYVEDNSSPDLFEVDDKFFLVMTKPTGSWLSIWQSEDLSEQDTRAENAIQLFEAKWRDQELLNLLESDPSTEEVTTYIAQHARTTYSESCWSFCELAEDCLNKLVTLDDPIILGSEVKQELGDIPLERMLQLLAGEIEANPMEKEILDRLNDALFEKEV